MTRRVTSIREFWNEVKPGDYARAVRNFSASEAQALCDWVKRNPRNWDSHTYDALMANNRRQVVYETKDFWGRYFRDNPEKYWQFLREMKIIEEPRLWRHNRNLTLSAIEQMLTPVPAPSYVAFGLGSEYNNREYSNAIKILQADIGCEVTGIYDQGTAIQLFRKKEIFIPKGKGYLAHEVNPNLLFDYRYEPQVYVVDRDLWQKMQFFYQDLTRDSNRDYWNNPPISSAVHEPVDYKKIMGETTGWAGSAFSFAGDFIEDYGKIWDKATQGDLVKTYHIPGKFLDGLSTIMEITEPVQAYIETGSDDRGQLVYDTSIKAAQVTTKKYLGKKVLKLVIKVVGRSNPIVYVITGVFGNKEIDELLDKYIFENEELKAFLTEQVLEPLREFMEPLNEEWQQQHEEDLRNGIRMD